MAKAVECPICHGTGKVTKYPQDTSAPYEVTCHGCGGKGWVEVAEDIPYCPHSYPFVFKPYYPIAPSTAGNPTPRESYWWCA